jgi:hypothetical protein
LLCDIRQAGKNSAFANTTRGISKSEESANNRNEDFKSIKKRTVGVCVCSIVDPAFWQHRLWIFFPTALWRADRKRLTYLLTVTPIQSFEKNEE